MKKLLALLIFYLSACLPAFALQHIQGYCEQGGQPVTTYGMDSTTKVQRSYPQCTVSVFVHNSGGTHATIYADETGSPLSPVFTADTTGHWSFYADSGRYDISLSGAGITPFTLWDISAQDTASANSFGASPLASSSMNDAAIAAALASHVQGAGTGKFNRRPAIQ